MAGPLPEYTLRRSPRSRHLRVTIDPVQGLVVTVPPATRRGWAHPEPTIEGFLRERESWVRRHVERHARQRAELAARGGLRDGGSIRYRGEMHHLRVVTAPGARRSSVARVGDEAGDELVVRLADGDRRSVRAVLEAWFRDRARAAIDAAIATHAPALEVQPTAVTVRDQRSRWGSASRKRRLSFSWRLVLAPPEALETVVVHELAHLRAFGHGPRFWALVASRRADHVTWRRWLRDHSYELHAALDDAPPAPADRPTPELASA
ncbi:MAG TPA: SprT family zinc-dependent metalloprotease [Candidatus Limnocylindrales bacterium]|nr:SprT family zinc-dependent metalloprotease [Candidatus Limnocylindrales bacterium]